MTSGLPLATDAKMTQKQVQNKRYIGQREISAKHAFDQNRKTVFINCQKRFPAGFHRLSKASCYLLAVVAFQQTTQALAAEDWSIPYRRRKQLRRRRH